MQFLYHNFKFFTHFKVKFISTIFIVKKTQHAKIITSFYIIYFVLKSFLNITEYWLSLYNKNIT